jgi:hypothetical protein
MHPADWIVLGLYLAATVGIGVLLGRLVKTPADLFAAGGRSPWWASGLSAFMTMYRDHPMESVLMTHPEDVVPVMVRDFDLVDGDGRVLVEVRDHRSARFVHRIAEPLVAQELMLRIHATHGAPAAVFRIRVLG